MANEVKWIKIATGIFDDDAFQIIDDLPECDAIELIWFKLLILAGKQNNHGLFLYKDTIAYTDEMLSSIFHRPLNTVRLAMETFVNLKMVERIDDVYAIPNWDKYQSLDSLESKKERDKEYSKKYREKQKLLIEEKKSSDSRLTSDEPSYSISSSNSDSLSDSIKEIIDYLNSKCNTRYTYKNKSYNKHITARLNDGFTVDDFKTVIDKKYDDWHNKPDMVQYLTPDTLFAPSKFEKYLNQPIRVEKTSTETYMSKWDGK